MLDDDGGEETTDICVMKVAARIEEGGKTVRRVA